MGVISKFKRILEIEPKRRRSRTGKSGAAKRKKAARKRRTPPRGKSGRFKKR
jgi:hypothetical protein